MLTVLPVPARAAASVRGVLPWAPLVGLVLGGIAAAAAVLGALVVSPLVGAVLGIAVLALLTRGLHLDGLADTADGLGPLRGKERALEVMRQGDVGPFGVAALVLTLLLQVACLAELLTRDTGWLAFWAAAVAARLAMTRTGLPGVRTAEGSALGAAVAGTVSGRWLLGWTAALAVLVLAATAADPQLGLRVLAASALGMGAAEVLHRRAGTRFGGVNGDVMGAMGETTTATALLAAAVVVP